MYVFISHASADRALAGRIADLLRREHLRVWDGSEILPGENWAERVGQALNEADAMVVLLTPAALKSPNVQHEIGFALGQKDYRGRLIPVLAGVAGELEESEIPWVLRGLHPVRLSGMNGDQEGLEQVADALKAAA